MFARFREIIPSHYHKGKCCDQSFTAWELGSIFTADYNFAKQSTTIMPWNAKKVTYKVIRNVQDQLKLYMNFNRRAAKEISLW